MALVLADRVQETSTTTGTGTLTLAGATSGYQTFSAGIGNGNTCYYTIQSDTGAWEVGIGTVGAGTLARTTLISSSTGSKISFGGTLTAFVTYPAEKAVYSDSTTIVAPTGALLPVASGGTGVGTLTGYVKASGTSAMTASATIPSSDLTGVVTSVTGTAPVASSGGTTPAISMAAANTTTNGYLTSTDWNTFNGKGAGTVTSVTGTAPVVSSGGATPAISMAAATTSVNGYLTSTDWNTFNGKGAGPSFSAYQSSAQTLSSNTWTKINLQTEEWDTNSNFDSTTNYRFTPTVAGYYQVNGAVCIASANTSIFASLYKNGSAYKFSNQSNNFMYVGNVNALVYLNGSTDYIELYCNLGVGQALTAASSLTYFQAALVRSA
jgi:hypothetical protein